MRICLEIERKLFKTFNKHLKSILIRDIITNLFSLVSNLLVRKHVKIKKKKPNKCNFNTNYKFIKLI